MSRRGRIVVALSAIASCSLVTWTCAHRGSLPSEHLAAQLEHGGRVRTYFYYEPPASPDLRPLVIALHGRLGTGVSQHKLSSLSALAEGEGFLVVYPDGIDRSWADGRGASPASKAGVDDVGFLSTLIDEFVAHHRADPSRVYVTGMSNGGFMALTLACRLADKVTAVGSVTGFMGIESAKSCAPTRPVSVAIVAGTEDPLVPFAGGALSGDRGTIIGAEGTLKRWVELNGCAGEGAVSALPDADASDGTRVERTDFTDCRDGTRVRLDVVTGGGHTWPGGYGYFPEAVIGKTSRDINASAELWRFFKPLQRK